ncbi:MAG: STAS domain-containing protein [Burkholderiales bacterium]|nr:STAS domain-containing protein [Burkholderiales bacterium]
MAALPAVLTMHESPAALPLLEAALLAESVPTLDASALTALDTATLAVLLQCKRSLAAQGKPLQIIGAPAKLGELARLYGVAELIGL